MSTPTLRGPRHDLGDFRPIDASLEHLKEALYPPRPDPKLTPQESALWEDIAVRNPKYVGAHFQPFVPQGFGLYESRNWSGAVLPVRPPVLPPNPGTPVENSTDPFRRVTGSWVIPNPHPMKINGKYKDGVYEMYSWVGLDGWDDGDCLKIGVVSELTVKNYQIIDRKIYAAILFRGADDSSIRYFRFENFIVEPGDLITGWVWGNIGDDTGVGWICNQGRNEWTSGEVVASAGVTLRGNSAEWIVAGKGPLEKDPNPFPNYGATVFFNGFAHHLSGKSAGLHRALLANAQDLNSAADRGHDILVYGGTYKASPPTCV